MNTLTATIVHKYFKEPFFTNISVVIEKNSVLMERADRSDAITVSIKGRKSTDAIKGLFFEIIDQRNSNHISVNFSRGGSGFSLRI